MIQFTISDDADQQFATILNGRRVTLRFRYNVTTDRWNMDVSIDDLPVLHGRRVVTGVDLLAPFNLGIGVIFASAAKAGSLPGRNDLPSGNVRLYHASDAEIAAVA